MVGKKVLRASVRSQVKRLKSEAVALESFKKDLGFDLLNLDFSGNQPLKHDDFQQGQRCGSVNKRNKGAETRVISSLLQESLDALTLSKPTTSSFGEDKQTLSRLEGSQMWAFLKKQPAPDLLISDSHGFRGAGE